MDGKTAKSVLRELGADLCGVAPSERFAGAPRGFRPCDIMPECRSVVVFARRIPAGVLSARSRVPYTRACEQAVAEVDSLAFRAACPHRSGIADRPHPAGGA